MVNSKVNKETKKVYLIVKTTIPGSGYGEYISVMGCYSDEGEAGTVAEKIRATLPNGDDATVEEVNFNAEDDVYLGGYAE